RILRPGGVLGFCSLWIKPGRLHRLAIALAVVAERFRKKLDRYTAAELRVSGLKHFAHSAFSEQRCDIVACEFGSDHGVSEIWLRILSNTPYVYCRNIMWISSPGVQVRVNPVRT